MSKTTTASTPQEVRVLPNGISMSPIAFPGTHSLHTISLLSPLIIDTKSKSLPHQNHQYRTILTITCTPIIEQGHSKFTAENCNDETKSPEDRDSYYDQDDSYYPPASFDSSIVSLPPIPTYNESQRAYYPHGVKRLPYFHPQKFSKRLRGIIHERRKPQPLSLKIEPPSQSYFSPSPTPCTTSNTTSNTPDSIIQCMLRILPTMHKYSEINEDTEQEEYEIEVGGFWKNVDHRVIIIGAVGMIMLAFGLGAWVMAVVSA